MKRTASSARHLTAASILVLAVAIGACSDNNNDNGGGTLPGSTDYVGLVASTDGGTGPLSITFASPVKAPPVQPAGTGPSFSSGAPVNATGTVSINGGAPVALSGTVDGGALSMTGGGWTLTGTLLNGKITGTFTAPGGVSGSLAAVSSTTGSPALAFCGEFSGTDVTSNPPSPDLGTFSAVVAGDVVLGTAVGDGGTVTDFSGSADQTAKTFTVSKTQGTVKLSASGTFTSTTTTGTYNVKVSGVVATSGTFDGSLCTGT